MNNIFKTFVLLGSLLVTSVMTGQTDDPSYYYVITKDNPGTEGATPRRVNIEEVTRIDESKVFYLTTNADESRRVYSRGHNVVKIKKSRVYMSFRLRKTESDTNRLLNSPRYNRTNNRR